MCIKLRKYEALTVLTLAKARLTSLATVGKVSPADKNSSDSHKLLRRLRQRDGVTNDSVRQHRPNLYYRFNFK